MQDVAKHEMTVLIDQGVHRCIRFGLPESNCMAFTIVTYPGHLCFSGDMGCFVFQRLQDMFEFFRTCGHESGINPAYWAEKLVAADRPDGFEQYEPELFTAAVQSRLENLKTELEEAGEQLPDGLMRAIEDDVISAADDGEHAAFTAANDFEFEYQLAGEKRTFRLDDFWETKLRDYSYRFIWCCYALVWAIGRFDESKAKKVAA